MMLTNQVSSFFQSGLTSPQTAHACDKLVAEDNKQYEIFHLSINLSVSCLVSVWPFGCIFYSLCWICSQLFLCWQAIRSQNAVHWEPDWRQSLWLQTSSEEDLPKKKAHQTVLNTELDWLVALTPFWFNKNISSCLWIYIRKSCIVHPSPGGLI